MSITSHATVINVAGLASVCVAMAYGNKLHRAIGLAQCAFLGCLVMCCSFLLSACTCHSLVLFTITCGAGTGLALGAASVCPLTAAYLYVRFPSLRPTKARKSSPTFPRKFLAVNPCLLQFEQVCEAFIHYLLCKRPSTSTLLFMHVSQGVA